jgi:hypothetical protein
MWQPIPEDCDERADKYLLEPALRTASWRPKVTAPMMAPESTPEKPKFLVDCPMCLGLRACLAQLTVQRLPFLYCRFCNSRVFVKSFSGLKVLRERHSETVEEIERLMALPAPEPTQAKPARRAKRKPA